MASSSRREPCLSLPTIPGFLLEDRPQYSSCYATRCIISAFRTNAIGERDGCDFGAIMAIPVPPRTPHLRPLQPRSPRACSFWTFTFKARYATAAIDDRTSRAALPPELLGRADRGSIHSRGTPHQVGARGRSEGGGSRTGPVLAAMRSADHGADVTPLRQRSQPYRVLDRP